MKVAERSTIISAFQEIKNRAEWHWRALYDSGQSVILVGTATCGRAAGALEVLQAIKDELSRQNLDYPVIEVGCLGHCYAEPLVIIYKPEYPPICYGHVNPVIAERLVKEFIVGDNPCFEFVLGALEENDLIPSFYDFPRAKYEKKIILKNCGQIDPTEIDHYIAKGGYSALVKVLQMQSEHIIEEVKRSGLRGRGGAGFPTGQKWDVCYSAVGEPKYVICNGDEGDPGAFIDRAILESDPHLVIEGMIIAGYTIGARYGYIYIRVEYPLAAERVQTALNEARRLNLLGKGILGSDFSFDIRLFQGSGAFVCGEETALIASLEGKPGIPYHRPPYPAVKGLYGKPTLLNNVKTFAYIRHIIDNGGEWFANVGTERSKGTAVFALAGKVVNTGLIEVPMGTTLRQVIFDVGGGIPRGRGFKAVQIGGPSGGCLPASVLDLPIDFDSLSDAGAMMGSGGMIVLDEDDCVVEIARYFMDFIQRESCGKCTFCRLGTKQMLETLDDITRGQGQISDIDMLIQLAEDIKAGSLCGLGKTAPNPVLTTLRYFEDEYEAHIREGRCPALMCRDLIAFYIIPEKCERSCDACIGTCTVEAIDTNKKRIKVVVQDKCVKCGTCLDACPPQYNAVLKLSPPSEVPASNQG
ncbi:MAG: NADH-quinone oxidoreductase subunit NuoF [Chloroflexi bacterium]|nr:NADH-quinone oxidoreductase subunit NuoF [Chloroflexota bacterium]